MTESGDTLVGTTIGSYRVMRRLGAGGVGTVYLGEHPHIGRRVAIKVLHDKYRDDDSVVGRFFDEARAVNRIGHANVVEVLDLAHLPDGRPYVLMEYLAGEDLAAILKRGPLPAPEAVAITREVLAALGAAHAEGILHRDIKPANVFRTADGRIKLLDFGLAKVMTAESARTRATAALLGTPAYMPPEQIEGGMLDERTDIYAVGVMLYEMLSGRRPHTAESLLHYVHLVLHAPAEPLVEAPPALATIVMHALAKRPEQRLASARAFDEALALLGYAPVSAPTPLLVETSTTGTVAPNPMVVTDASHAPGLQLRRFAPWLAAAAAVIVTTGATAAYFATTRPAPSKERSRDDDDDSSRRREAKDKDSREEDSGDLVARGMGQQELTIRYPTDANVIWKRLLKKSRELDAKGDVVGFGIMDGRIDKRGRLLESSQTSFFMLLNDGADCTALNWINGRVIVSSAAACTSIKGGLPPPRCSLRQLAALTERDLDGRHTFLYASMLPPQWIVNSSDGDGRVVFESQCRK